MHSDQLSKDSPVGLTLAVEAIGHGFKSKGICLNWAWGCGGVGCNPNLTWFVLVLI